MAGAQELARKAYINRSIEQVVASGTAIDRERERVREIGDDLSGWRRWGPYVSDRSWGTVREDYSHDGNAWGYLTYDMARAKAYRWGEDGIAGLCDRYQLLCFAPAFWNERDPHLKERLFGVNPYEGNHGEDVKEYYFHVDNTPTHSYMCLLYKYPQAAFPYRELIEDNQRRAGQGPEYELLDTGVFDDDRYFDIFIEYAKADPEDLAIRITAHNRGPDAAPLHILPTLWFRNTWAWGPAPQPEPRITCERADGVCLVTDDSGTPPIPTCRRTTASVRATCTGRRRRPLFTDNETNGERAYGPGNTSRKPYTKDAFHRAICEGDTTAVRPDGCGTKAALHYRYVVPAGGAVTLRLRLTDRRPGCARRRRRDHRARKAEADVFYAGLAPREATADEKLVQRRALAGLLWTQAELPLRRRALARRRRPGASAAAVAAHDPQQRTGAISTRCASCRCPTSGSTRGSRRGTSRSSACRSRSSIAKFAKEQLWLLLFEQFQHPNGQLPAYEWEFCDLNPPVHAWAVWRVYNMDRLRNGVADRAVARALLPQAADQLRELGQQGRPRRQQRVRGRLPRPRQHHGHRSQRAQLRTARRSSSPTRPAGWACSA